MVDETELSQEKSWWYETLGQQVVASLQRRNITAFYVPTGRDAFKKVLELIPEGATVGWGDSTTIYQIGVFDELTRTRPGKVFDSFARKSDGSHTLSPPERLDVQRKAATADVFLAGVNAVTIDGRLVSTDMTGNRVAPTIFGPKKVIMVAGANKIVNSLDEALQRVKQAAIINIRRHVLKHGEARFADLPCTKKGVCVDCVHPQRLCHYTVIIEGEAGYHRTVSGDPHRIHVIIVGEELGI